MDVVLLSRMIRDLMLDRDALSLPGLGTFGAESMPASFSDRGFTINPPYRRLTFSKLETSDGLLAELYARSNGIGVQEAAGVIRAFSEDLSKDLQDSRTVDFPGLGRLRSTREGHLFFVPDQDLDITPEACGLESVSLKSHAPAAAPGNQLTSVVAPEPEDAVSTAQNVPQETSAPLRPSHSLEDEAVGPSRLSETISPPVVPQGTPALRGGHGRPQFPETHSASVPPASSGSRKRNRPLRWAIGAAVAAVLLLGVFTVVSRIKPGITDRLLYSEDQLAIINAPEDGTYLSR